MFSQADFSISLSCIISWFTSLTFVISTLRGRLVVPEGVLPWSFLSYHVKIEKEALSPTFLKKGHIFFLTGQILFFCLCGIPFWNGSRQHLFLHAHMRRSKIQIRIQEAQSHTSKPTHASSRVLFLNFNSECDYFRT